MLSTRQNKIDFLLCSEFANPLMFEGCCVAEFAHIAQDRDPPLRRPEQVGEGGECREEGLDRSGRHEPHRLHQPEVGDEDEPLPEAPRAEAAGRCWH